MTTGVDQVSVLASRILPVAKLDTADEAAVAALEELAKKKSGEIEQILKATDDLAEIPDSQRNFVKAVIIAGHWIIAKSTGLAMIGQLQVADLINSAKRSFKIPYIQQNYTKWKSARFQAFELWKEAQPQDKRTWRDFLADRNNFDVASYESWKSAQQADPAELTEDKYLDWLKDNHDTPEAYVRVLRHEDTIMDGLFRVLLGDNYARPPKRIRKSRPKVAWAFFSRLFREDPKFLPYESAEDTLKGLAVIGTNANKELDQAVDSSIELIRLADQDESIGFSGALLAEFLSNNPECRQKLIEKVQKVFDVYRDKGKLEPAALRRLTGERKHHEQVIVDEMVGAFALLFEEAQQIKLARSLSDADVDVEGLLVKFLQIDGMENFFEMALRQVQHEHGYIFEQLVTLCYLKKGFEPDMIILQSKIADKSGPDLLILSPKREYIEMLKVDPEAPLPATGVFEVQIIQMKSYKNLLDVIRATDTGEALAQARSDIRRLIRNLITQDKAHAENIGLSYGSTIFFKIDWFHIQKDSFFANVDEMMNSHFDEFGEITVEIDGVVYKVDKTMVEGLDPNELLHSTDPVISKAVRYVFKKTYVDSHVEQINDALKSYETEWVDSFLIKDKSELSVNDIRSALQDEIDLAVASSVPDAAQRFKQVQAMLDKFPADPAAQGPELDKVRAALATIYRSTFNLDPVGVIKVEVDLVDSMIDDDIVPMPLNANFLEGIPNPKGLH